MKAHTVFFRTPPCSALKGKSRTHASCPGQGHTGTSDPGFRAHSHGVGHALSPQDRTYLVSEWPMWRFYVYINVTYVNGYNTVTIMEYCIHICYALVHNGYSVAKTPFAGHVVPLGAKANAGRQLVFGCALWE